jgi:hypothetical protein
MVTQRTKARSKVRASAAARSVTIRLPVKVLAHFQEGGAGYQTRICRALEEHIEREKRFRSFERVCAKLKRLSVADRKALGTLLNRPLNSDSIRDPFSAVSD